MAASQPEGPGSAPAGLGLPIALVASSAGWGVEKPDPEFFARAITETGVPAGQVAYVGDRLDNDVLPARRAGMVAIFIRRGPWGLLHAHQPEAAHTDARVDSLIEIPTVFGIQTGETA